MLMRSFLSFDISNSIFRVLVMFIHPFCRCVLAGGTGERVVLQTRQALSEGIYVVIAGCRIDVLNNAEDHFHGCFLTG